MNENELQSMLNKLSAQAESVRQKHDLTKKLEKVEEWIRLLRGKAEEIVAMGAVPSLDVGAKLAELERERLDLRSMLTPASPSAIKSLVEPKIVKVPDPPKEDMDLPPLRAAQDSAVPATGWKEPLTPDEIKLLDGLYTVMDTLDLEGWSPEERWLQYDSWACQWRLIVSKRAFDVTEHSPLLRKVFGKIRDLMKSDGRLLWYIDGLDRNRQGDWESRYKECERKREELASARKEEEKEGDVKEQAIWTLMNQVRDFPAAANKEDAERKLRHQIRETAKHKHLREEVAEIISPLREKFETEFGFLWFRAAPEETIPTRSMSTRDLVARLMRRMKAKSLIGACHGPFEQIYKGVPEQDKGRAKDLLEQLGKAGVVRFKGSVIGIRVSLEPKRMPEVDRLIEGEDPGVPAITAILNKGI